MFYLSVVIPVYNEQGSIERVISEHVNALEQLKDKIGSWEIVCLDDASTDDSLSIMRAYAAREPHLKVLTNPINQGITYSFNRLYHEAKGEYIYLTAGDGQWPALNLPVLIETCLQKKADLVIGVRQGRQQVYGLTRQALSYGFNCLAKILLKIDVQDANGIKLGRREIFQMDLASTSFFAEIERIYLALKRGYNISYADVQFISRAHGQAKGAGLSNVIHTLKDFSRFVISKKS